MDILVRLLLVMLGSGIGGACRYLTDAAIRAWLPAATFPWGTFAVNVAGCLLIGLLCGLPESGDTLSPRMRLLLATGFCGGFTTFSTFINDSHSLLADGLTPSLLYTGTSIAAGLIALRAGYALARL